MARINGKKEPPIKALVIENRLHGLDPVAKLNRKILAEAAVFAVSVSGGLGCGKTALIEATIQKLLPDIRVGVIACDVASHLDTERIIHGSDQVVQINTGQQGTPDASHIHDGLQWLDLSKIDLLLIENVGILVGPDPLQLGQDATAAVFSVAGGHDKASKNPALVKSADIILLNKTDLLRAVPFDLSIFRADVRRLNPNAQLLELSSLNGEGLDQWLAWLSSRIKKPAPANGY